MRRSPYLTAALAIVFALAIPAPALAQEGNTYLLTVTWSDGSTDQWCAIFTDNSPGTVTVGNATLGTGDGSWSRWNNNRDKKWFIVLGDQEWVMVGKIAGQTKIKKGNILMWGRNEVIQGTYKGVLDMDCDPDVLGA